MTNAKKSKTEQAQQRAEAKIHNTLNEAVEKEANSPRRAAEAAVGTESELAAQLGLLEEELEVVNALAITCLDRIEAAPVDIILSTAETVIAKKFPGNDAVSDALNVDSIVADALKYIEDNVFGRAVGSLKYPAPIDNAKAQLAKASTRLAGDPTDPARQQQYAQAVRWLAQMRCQVELKKALEPIFHAFYRVQTGKMYQAPASADATGTTDVADDLAMNM
jgi:hypothetical protein